VNRRLCQRRRFSFGGAADRIKLVTSLGRQVGSSQAAKEAEAKVDDRLFSLLVREIKRAPSPAYVPVLAGIELHRDVLSLDALRHRLLLEAGLAVAKADRGSRGAVHAGLLRWLPEKDEDDPSMSDDAWRATVKRFRALGKE
jgi:hypothetical protein